MVVTRFQQMGKGGGVKPVIAALVELDSRWRDLQKGQGGFVIPQHVPQAKECLAQIQQRLVLRLFRPEQTGQRRARMGARRLDRQIGQQGLILE